MIGPDVQSGKKLAHRHPLVSGRARAGVWDLAVCLLHSSMEGWMDVAPSPCPLPCASSMCQGVCAGRIRE